MFSGSHSLHPVLKYKSPLFVLFFEGDWIETLFTYNESLTFSTYIKGEVEVDVFALDTYQSNTSQVTTNKKMGYLIKKKNCTIVLFFIFLLGEFTKFITREFSIKYYRSYEDKGVFFFLNMIFFF